VAAQHPEKILKEPIDPGLGLQGFQVRRLVKAFGLTGEAAKGAGRFLNSLVKAYHETDSSLLEVNPLVLTTQGNLVALDAKLSLDDNALYRHPDLAALRDEHEEDPADVEAGKYNLNFIKLDGNVGCMVNGAGLAMATMDIIRLHGGMPANFLDVGGGANPTTVKNAFRILQNDPSVKAILVNIFGGIVRCDRVANGIVEAVKETGLKLPLVVRLQGTNADLAKDILAKSGMAITPAETLTDAAVASVKLAAG
jgi:succinyl-CoA synthetase beta subunit